MITISAIICTHNRRRYLPGAIQSLGRQSLPNDEYEILVIDNASIDGTQELLQKLAPTLPNLRLLAEPRLGLSHARNRGLRHSQGRIVAFLDDDAMAAKDWLEQIINAFNSGHPSLAAVGGPVAPIWEAARPAWLGDELLPFLSLLDDSRLPGPGHQPHHWLPGVNLSLLRQPLEEIGGFDTTLGRVGNNLLSGEESLALSKLQSRGWHSLYHPKVRVEHFVPPERMTKKWFLKRFYWHGVTRARLGKQTFSPAHEPGLASPTYTLRGKKDRRKIWRSAILRPRQRFVALCAAATAQGYVMGRLGLR